MADTNELFSRALVVGFVRYAHASVFEQKRYDACEAHMRTHLDRPEFEPVREEALWWLRGSYALHYATNVLTTTRAILSGTYGAVWESARKFLPEGSACDNQQLDPELTGITEEARLALVDKSRRLHLAIAIGYIRCALAAGAGGSFSDAYAAAKAHLTRPEFSDFGEIALSEICEFSKDGLVDEGRKKIEAAQSGRHDLYWAFANRALEGRGWPPVNPEPIDPSLLT